MNGAIFYSTKYGSTAQYAQWISEATGPPAFPQPARWDRSALSHLFEVLKGPGDVLHEKFVTVDLLKVLAVQDR